MLFDYEGAKRDIEKVAPGESWLLDVYFYDHDARDFYMRTHGLEPTFYGSTRDPVTGKDACYVATRVYGDRDAPEVRTLRRFRDEKLKKSVPGRAFVRFYYRVSPALVKRFGKYKLFRRISKAPIDALVRRLQNKGTAGNGS